MASLAAAVGRFVAEASDGYRRKLVDCLHGFGPAVALVNRRLVRAFAVSIGADAKTDAIDASVIRRFVQMTSMLLHPVCSEAFKRLASLVGRRKQLLRIIHKQESRLARADDSSCRTAEILRSVSGVGPALTSTTPAGLPEIGMLSGGTILKLTGAAPINRDSGKHHGQTTGATPHWRGPVVCPPGVLYGDVVGDAVGRTDALMAQTTPGRLERRGGSERGVALRSDQTGRMKTSFITSRVLR